MRIIPGLERGPASPGSSNRGGGGGSASVRCLETNPKFLLWWSGCTVANGPPRLLNPSGSVFHSISIASLVFDLPTVLTLSLKGQACFCLVYPRCRGQPVLNMFNPVGREDTPWPEAPMMPNHCRVHILTHVRSQQAKSEWKPRTTESELGSDFHLTFVLL